MIDGILVCTYPAPPFQNVILLIESFSLAKFPIVATIGIRGSDIPNPTNSICKYFSLPSMSKDLKLNGK